MSKRKAANNANAPPAQRAAVAAPAVAAAAHADENEAEELRRVRLSVPRATRSFNLAELLHSNKPIDEKLAAVAAMIENDAIGGDALIDLSMPCEERGTLLMLLIDVLKKSNEEQSDGESATRQKRTALGHFSAPSSWAHISKLMGSYDVEMRRSGHATCTLHIVTAAGVPVHERDWPYRLARLLLQHGADVHAVDLSGTTPMHQWVCNDYDADDRACGLQLLLEHGADPNHQDADGDALLHNIVHHANCNERQLRHLAESRLLDRVDLFTRNHDGHTPLSLAQQRAAEKPHDAARKGVHRFLAALVQGCRRDTGAFVLAKVGVHLIPCLAAVVADFLFGVAQPQ